MWLLSLPLPAIAFAQAVVLDEGSFVVEIDNRTIGTENFRIRQSSLSENAQTIAQGNLEFVNKDSTHIVQSVLGAVGINMSLDAYQVKVSGSNNTQVRMQRRGNRIVSETKSEIGIIEREYRRLSSRTPIVVLDNLLAHQYFFLTPHQKPGDSRVSIIYPQSGKQENATLRMEHVDPITLGGNTIQAQHLQLIISNGDIHEIWLDNQNRVLRIEIPKINYIAVRKD
tara:strand:+ start:2134 stop:2811 length:678 start_codon:yes stop_codon:yes gene_type:complete